METHISYAVLRSQKCQCNGDNSLTTLQMLLDLYFKLRGIGRAFGHEMTRSNCDISIMDVSPTKTIWKRNGVELWPWKRHLSMTTLISFGSMSKTFGKITPRSAATWQQMPTKIVNIPRLMKKCSVAWNWFWTLRGNA